MSPYLTRYALILLALSALAVGLITVRGRMFHRRVRPMLWNLLLAWTPMLLVIALDLIVVDTPDRVDDTVAVSAFGVVLTLFALFLPNSPYLITELSHLREPREAIPTWYDVIAILSLTMCGLLLCCVSLAYVQLILDRSVVGATWSWIIVTGFLLLANLGVYVGRELRFNSWDAVVRPGRVLARTGRYLFAERRILEAVSYTVVFSAFTGCVYLVVALPLLP
jgi:uncharacterized membrane protein